MAVAVASASAVAAGERRRRCTRAAPRSVSSRVHRGVVAAAQARGVALRRGRARGSPPRRGARPGPPTRRARDERARRRSAARRARRRASRASARRVRVTTALIRSRKVPGRARTASPRALGCARVTAIDWVIVAFTVLLAAVGWRQGFVVGAAVAGRLRRAARSLGTPARPALLPDGSRRPTRRCSACSARCSAARSSRPGSRASARRCAARLRVPGARARSTACSARCSARRSRSGMAWIVGRGRAADAGRPRAARATSSARRSCARLNDVLPPSGPLLNALARFDPFPRIDGPGRPTSRRRAPAIARDPRGARPRPRRRADPRDGLRARRRGLGLGRRRRARRDQRARRRRPGRHRRAGPRARATELDAPRGRLRRAQRRRGAARRRASTAPGAAAGRRAAVGAGRRDPRLPAQRPLRRARRRGWAQTRDGALPGRLRPRAGHAADDVVPRRWSGRATRAARWSTATGAWSRRSSPPSTRRGAARRLRRAQRDRARARLARARRRAPVPHRARAPGGRSDSAARRRPAATLRRHGQDPRHRREAVRRTRPRARAARARSRRRSGAGEKTERWLEGPEHVITWAVGHLVQLAEPDEYDDKFKKWRMADLPIVPAQVQARRARRALAEADDASSSELLRRDDVDLVINACDAGREGELIFAYLFEKAGAKKPVKRLWLSLDDQRRDARGVRRTCATAPSSRRSRRPRARARRPTGSSA